ncbi:MAG: MerR family transcriptional regulator [Microbacteriaceae bacterium]|nr:MerR family transcriptional regulator [Microbacteriaceae bacterium]
MEEWSIQQVARIAGTTSRTLRHYDSVGLVTPSRIGSNGYRYYDEAALVRLQRVLLLRELGVGLPQIGEILAQQQDEVAALTTHLALLTHEQQRLARQITAVEHTINYLNRKETLMADTMFDGFDHTQYQQEVEERWGAEAYAASDAWWRGQSADEQSDWKAKFEQHNADWIAAANNPALSPASPEAQALALRHVDWLRGIPGTPASSPDGDLRAYVSGLAEMYVSDDRFAANYGGIEGAEFVRDALLFHLDEAQ